MAKPFQTSVVTANDLVEGHSVFLAPEGWHRDIARALIACTVDEAAELEALAGRFVDDNVVVGPYLVAVSCDSGAPVPVARRERIRADGRPTIAFGPALRVPERVAA